MEPQHVDLIYEKEDSHKIYWSPKEKDIKDFLNIYETNGKFILNILNELRGIFNVLYYYVEYKDFPFSHTNVTDCIYTSGCVWKFFDVRPRMMLEVASDNIYMLDNIINYNILNIELTGLLSHNFIIIKVEEKWFLINSYANKYQLKIKTVENVTENLAQLIRGSCECYNSLFDTVINKDKKSHLTILCGKYNTSYDYINKINTWINTYKNMY